MSRDDAPSADLVDGISADTMDDLVEQVIRRRLDQLTARSAIAGAGSGSCCAGDIATIWTATDGALAALQHPDNGHLVTHPAAIQQARIRNSYAALKLLGQARRNNPTELTR